MAQTLSFKEIVKPFYRATAGIQKGQYRYKALAKKIEDKTPILMSDNEMRVLSYAGTKERLAFTTGSLNDLAAASAGRTQPFRDDDGRKFSLSSIVKTKDFGGAEDGKSAGGGGDPHELMTGALLVKYGSKGGTRRIPANDYQTLTLSETLIKEIKSSAGLVVGYKLKEKEAFDGDFTNLAKAISAANGILKDLSNATKVVKVYQTGAKWDKEVSKYGDQAHALFGKNYNTSDLVVELYNAGQKRKKYLGVSLKKKPKRDSKDPTIVNRTVTGEKGLFQSLVRSKDMHILRKHLGKLYQARAQFFYNFVEACIVGLPDTNIGRQDLATHLKALDIPDGTKEEEAYKKKNIKANTGKFERERLEKLAVEEGVKARGEYIKAYLADLKKKVSKNPTTSKVVTKEAAKIGNKKAKDALFGAYPKHTKVFNTYFATLFQIMTLGETSKLIAEGLLNIVFKLDIYEFTRKVAQNNSEEFIFTLVTGIGEVVNDVKVTPYPASVIPERLSTPTIIKMIGDAGPGAYNITGKPGYKQPHQGGSSASLKFNIYLKGLHIIDLEIRYKGEVTPEPQFQAYITPLFTDRIKDKPNPDTPY